MISNEVEFCLASKIFIREISGSLFSLHTLSPKFVISGIPGYNGKHDMSLKPRHGSESWKKFHTLDIPTFFPPIFHSCAWKIGVQDPLYIKCEKKCMCLMHWQSMSMYCNAKRSSRLIGVQHLNLTLAAFVRCLWIPIVRLLGHF